jgi:hypothetical protein
VLPRTSITLSVKDALEHPGIHRLRQWHRCPNKIIIDTPRDPSSVRKEGFPCKDLIGYGQAKTSTEIRIFGFVYHAMKGNEKAERLLTCSPDWFVLACSTGSNSWWIRKRFCVCLLAFPEMLPWKAKIRKRKNWGAFIVSGSFEALPQAMCTRYLHSLGINDMPDCRSPFWFHWVGF